MSPKSQVMFASAFSWIGDFFLLLAFILFKFRPIFTRRVHMHLTPAALTSGAPWCTHAEPCDWSLGVSLRARYNTTLVIIIITIILFISYKVWCVIKKTPNVQSWFVWPTIQLTTVVRFLVSAPLCLVFLTPRSAIFTLRYALIRIAIFSMFRFRFTLLSNYHSVTTLVVDCWASIIWHMILWGEHRAVSAVQI